MVSFGDRIQLRLAFFGVIALIVFSLLLGRLWYLQVLAVEDYSKQAENNRARVIPLEAFRGNIYDRKGRVLVKNRPALAIAVEPSLYKKYKRVKINLSKLLQMSVKEIEGKIKEEERDPLRPRIIKRDVDKKVVSIIKEHPEDFPGVKIETIAVRDYPEGNLGAHFLGYVGEISKEELGREEYQDYEEGEEIGKTGVEREYDSLLRGLRGHQRIEVNALGRPLRVLDATPPLSGNNLRLTIDRDIQKATEEALVQAISNARTYYDKDNQKFFTAPAGAAVVIDPRNGAIRALASYPTYDPRLFVGGISPERWKHLNNPANNYPLNNRVVMNTYPPASTFKPITGISALSSGLISEGNIFICRGIWKGEESWPNYFRCWFRRGHGTINFFQGVVVSCDVVFYEIGYLFYQQRGEPLQDWAKKFGFGRPTGIDLPSEAKGRVPTKAWKEEWNKRRGRGDQQWYPGDTVNMAIGQGDLLVTPLQLATAYAAIANGGTILKPYLGETALSYDGKIKRRLGGKKVGQLRIPPSDLALLKEALKGVTTNGTARAAFSGFPVPIAGKTGTAQVQGKQDTAWFASYGPADDPQYVVVVMIEQGGFGGMVAAPAVRQIYSKIFGIPEKEQVQVGEFAD